jgi:hypothetical protein
VSHSKEHLKAWWQPILQMRLEDPQQEPPFWAGTNNAVLNTPFPGIQIKALAIVGTSEAGVFLSGTRRSNVLAIQKDLKQERLSLLKELPKGTEIRNDHHFPIMLYRDGFRSDRQKREWIVKTMNRFVKVLRPRLRKWYEESTRVG